MKEWERKAFLAAIGELAKQIAIIKENECGNSGLNWLDEFTETLLKKLEE